MAFRWRIRHKLMLGLGLVIAILALMLGGAVKGLTSYRSAMRAIESKVKEELGEANKLKECVSKGLVDPGANVPNEGAVLRLKIAEARAALDAYQAKLDESVAQRHYLDNGYSERKQVDALLKGFAELDKAILGAEEPQVFPGRRPPLVQQAPVKKVIDQLVETTDSLINVIYDQVDKRIYAAKKVGDVVQTVVATTTVIGVLLMLGLLRSFYRWVFFPIRDLQEGAGRVAQGNFEQRIEVHSHDELEDLADAFNDMTGRLSEMYGDLERQVNERSRQLVRSERLASVGYLAAGVAHEINNPLASIAFCSEALENRLAGVLARSGGQPSEQDCETIAKYLKMIQQEAFRCKHITQRLLEFSRGGERQREHADMGEIVQSVLDMVQTLPNSKGKQIAFGPTGRLLAWVNAEEIKSVILNLVINALDSMDEGGKLIISQRQRDGMAEVTFSDSGCGMSAEVLENIFEPFFTRSRTGKGTGLGLSISHRIVNQHGGEIEASSAGPNQGSTFTVRLPLQPAEDQRPEAKQQRREDGDPELFFHDRSTERRGRKAA